jgi:hypothetical protein
VSVAVAPRPPVTLTFTPAVLVPTSASRAVPVISPTGVNASTGALDVPDTVTGTVRVRSRVDAAVADST